MKFNGWVVFSNNVPFLKDFKMEVFFWSKGIEYRIEEGLGREKAFLTSASMISFLRMGSVARYFR